ncbi:uncharacterized protein LOC126755787 [Bactrocera neohumeralis]|uniref:uncharacterized protein LOC126755787 n=1 Tax=Bactrocera neohumeralis TaxID=98809 RepID=UPI002165D560|nr:uncharacterized protein LOC126755787 [Bactrocera neohumeralis]
MKRRHFANCLSKEKRTFQSNIKVIKKYLKGESENESGSVSSSAFFEGIPLVSNWEPDPSVLGSVVANYESDASSDSEPEASTSIGFSVVSENNDEINKCNEIKSWAIRNNISQIALEDLLKTLRKVGVDGMPLSAKTLLNTSKEKINITEMQDGEFLYLGIQNYFVSSPFNYLEGKNEVYLDIGVDGLKLYKSSNRVLWPILGSVVGFPNISPFMIACYSGFKKPSNIDQFMSEFCAEVVSLRATGIKVGFKPNVLKFNIRLFVCDSPARAFVTGVISHNGKNGCPKCCQEGTYQKNRVSFQKKIGSLRSDTTFMLRSNPAHHLEDFKFKKSILEESDFGMVSQFPLDSMHLVDLGVTKKLLKLATRPIILLLTKSLTMSLNLSHQSLAAYLEV